MTSMIWLFYSFQILIVVAVIFMVMIQKNGEGLFSSSTKVFGIRGRSNVIVKITYVLGAMFLINNVVLGILYKRKYTSELIKETKEQPIVNQKDINAKKEASSDSQIGNTKSVKKVDR